MNCFFGHDWGEWKVIKEGELKITGTESVIGYVKIQERQCKKCKKTEMNEQSIYL